MIHASRLQYVWNGMAFSKSGTVTSLSTGEVFSMCNDPFCTDHSKETCAVRLMQDASYFVVSPSSTTEDMVIYMSLSETQIDTVNMVALANHQLIRYHYFTGEKEVIRENMLRPAGVWTLDPLTEDIYYMAYIVNEDDETEQVLCVVNGITDENRVILSSLDELKILYAEGDVLYGYGKYIYRIDLSAKEPVPENTGYQGYNILNGYLYYQEAVSTERLYVPDDLIKLSEQYGIAPYQDFTIYDFYRLDITKEDGEPELVASRIASGFAAGDYISYIASAPQYHCSVLYENAINYALDDPNVSSDAKLMHKFTAHDSTIYILDDETLETVTVIDLTQYQTLNIDLQTSSEGVFAQFYNYAPEDYLGINAPSYFSGFIPYDKPFLTDEDIIPLTPD